MKYLGKAIAICLMASVAIVSCKKSKDTPAEQEGKKVSKIQESQDTYTTFEYDADKLLRKVTSFDVGIQEELTITRNAQKKISEVSFTNGIKLVYVYSGENVDSIKAYFGPALAGAYKLQYTNGKVSREIFLFVENGTLEERVRVNFTYSAAGDITEAVREELINNTWTTTYKNTYTGYDQRINPLYSLRELAAGMFPLGISPHNPTGMQEFDENNALVQTTEYTYTYDNGGNVTQMVTRETPAGGTATSTTSTVTYLP